MVFTSVMTRPRALFLSGLVALTAGAPALAEPRYRDGDYSGQVFDTGWGEVQMKAIIRGGALVDVQYLQFPYHRLRSMQISNEALPQLKAEAIKKQSAAVDMISGATATVEGFRASLASALAQASGGGV